MYRVFQFFVQLHNRPPQTFVTDEQQTIISALEELKAKEFWNGTHVFDPWHALKNIRKKLRGEEQTKRDMMRTFRTLAMTRSAY